MSPVEMTVQALLQARRSGCPAPAPTLPDAASAYAVQDGVALALGWSTGAAPRAWKSGGASRQAVQTHAALPPEGVWPSPADARGRHWQLRGIEAELALRLGRPVDAALAATLDRDAAAALIDAMAVSIEIVDSRWVEALQAPPLAKLADLQSHGALVLGTWGRFDPARDWSRQVCRVRIGTAPEQPFTGTHSMGDPAWVLPAWLRHATRDGATVAAGTVITTGTWCGLPLALPGDAVHVAFDGIGEARVQF